MSQTTLFHYRVNDSDAAMIAGGTVPSTGGTNGQTSGGLNLSADVPVLGVPGGAGNRSLDNGGGGGVTAPGTRQLSNAFISAAGGFTYETWFKWAGGGNVNSIIDYAGTEKLRVPSGGGVLDLNFDSGSGAQDLGAVGSNQWHYVATVFEHDGNPESGGKIDGTLTWYLDGVTPTGSASVTKDDFGDSLNRTVAVAMHPLGFGGDYFDGLVFEPRVTLGTLAPGELLYSAGPQIASFTTNIQNITGGESARLDWNVTDASTVEIDQGIGTVANPTGFTTVSPVVTTTYKLTATNPEGSSIAQVTVFVNAPPAEPILNEFLADNAGVLLDQDGGSSDWIEIRNPNAFDISIGGWSLTDDPLGLIRWTFPTGTNLPGNGYLVVFASAKNLTDPAGELHTNFRLNDAGEYLALLRPDLSVAQAYSPTFPPQFEDKSYGQIDDGPTLGYFDTPTPGALNGNGVLGFVSDTKFLPDRGFFESPTTVNITSITPGATIIYTTDASTPTLRNGTQVPASNASTPPAAMILVSQSTTLRAAAFLTGYQATNTDTHTYLFLDDVILQSPSGQTPSGWPAGSVNGQTFNYGMDPNIVGSRTWGSQLIGGLKQIPSISIVTDQEHLTSSTTGIYTHAGSDGDTWERPGSIELLLPDNTPGFQVNGGLRIRGGFSRGGFNPKHSFRLFFRSLYGTSKLNYPLFGNDGADDFDKMDLRTAQNYAWSNNTGNNELHNTFIRDVFHRDTQRDMEQPHSRSRYYHLYLNGQYWGLYQTQERTESAFANSYFGGARDNWDVIKPSGGAARAVDGTITAYNALHSLATAGFSTDTAYYGVQGKNPDGSDNPAIERHLDVDNLIDYMITNIYCGNRDGPLNLGSSAPNNFYVLRNRDSAARDSWKFFCHDSEHSMAASNHSTTINVTGNTNTGSQASHFNPRWLSQQLAQHPDYRRRFGDRIQKHFFNGGALTEAGVLNRWNMRANEFDLAIIAESARWGDQHNEPPLDKQTWENELNWMRNTFIPSRASTVLTQLRNASLFPSIEAPTFSQHGGSILGGTNIGISAPSGTIYHSTDGSDPRFRGTLYTGPIPISQPSLLRAAVLAGGQWSALTEATFLIDTVPASADNLVISEFSYRPAPATPSEDPAGTLERSDFEFIELLNTGSQTIDLTGVRFTAGVDYAFTAYTILGAGERLLLVNNTTAFEARHGTGLPIAGEFGGSLSNDGETITLLNATDLNIQHFVYNDQAPWPTAPDGQGYSLVLVCPHANPDHGLPSNWRSSAALHGVPGGVDSTSLSEWMSANGVTDPLEDLDADGIPALIEFAGGTDPNAHSQDRYHVSVITLVVSGIPTDYLEIGFRRDLSAEGISITSETSIDLLAWDDDPLSVIYLGEQNHGDGSATISWHLATPTGNIDHQFLRLVFEAK